MNTAVENQSDEQKGILWLKLSEQSKNLLLDRFHPRYPNVYCDHITLAYDVSLDSVSEFIGKVSRASASAIASNEKVEAIRVVTDGLPDSYGVPHVTLSTTRGTKPYESVAMLKGEHEEVLIEPNITVEGYIEFIML